MNSLTQNPPADATPNNRPRRVASILPEDMVPLELEAQLFEDIEDYDRVYSDRLADGKPDQHPWKFKHIPRALVMVASEVKDHHFRFFTRGGPSITMGDLLSVCLLKGVEAALDEPACKAFMSTADRATDTSNGIGFYNRIVLHSTITGCKFKVEAYRGTDFQSFTFRIHTLAYRHVFSCAARLKLDTTVLAVPAIMYGLAQLEGCETTAREWLLGEYKRFIEVFEDRDRNIKAQLAGYTTGGENGK